MTTRPPLNYLALLGPTEPDNALARLLKSPPPPSRLSGLFGLGEPPPSISALLRAAYPPQPPFDDPLREAAWVRTAGHVNAPDATDEEGAWLDRNAKQGEYGCWQAAHYLADALGGPATPQNVRALNSYRNLSDGGILGNLLKNRRP